MQKMTMLKTVLVCALLAVACGDSDDDSGDAAAGATGGNGTGGNGTGGTAGQRDEAGNCLPADSTCTKAEQEAYTKCQLDTCDTEYKACLGDGYRSGTYAGLCGEFLNCTKACDCGDTSCITQCPLPASDCQTCLQTLATCTMKCTAPACASAGGGGTGGSAGGKTCADLKACCDGMAAGATQDQCNQFLMAGMAGGDQVCAGAYIAAMCK